MPHCATTRRQSRVACYLASREPDADRVAAQEIRLRTFLLDRPDLRPVAEYHDYGYRDNRVWPRLALQRALADAQTGRFEVLLVSSLDRLGRNLSKVRALLADLDQAGVAIVSADGAVDTTRPAGRFALAVLTVIAEFEAALHTDRDRTARRCSRRPGGRRHGCG